MSNRGTDQEGPRTVRRTSFRGFKGFIARTRSVLLAGWIWTTGAEVLDVLLASCDLCSFSMACGAADANVDAAMAATSEFEIVAESMLKVYVCAGWGSHWGGGHP